MKTKLILVCLLILALFLVTLPSCRSYPSPTIPSSLSLLIPQRADLIAKVDIQRILSDGDFAYLYQQWANKVSDMPTTLNQFLDLIRSETGVDPRDFTEVVAFTNVNELIDFMGASSYRGSPYFGSLLRGSFSEQSMVQNAEWKANTKFETYNYKGVKVYSHTEGGVVIVSFAFIDNHLIVVGSATAVEDVIDIMVGEKQPLSGAVCDLYESLGDVLFKLSSSVPGIVGSLMPTTADLNDADFSLRALRDVNMLGCTFGKIGSTFITELQLHCAYADSAEDINTLVNALRAFVLEQIEKEIPEPEIKQLIRRSLTKVEARAYGSVFSLRVVQTTADIEELIRSLAD